MISINQEAMRVVRKVLEAPERLGVRVTTLENGSTLIDMGQQAPGGWAAARYYTQITLGGLARVSFEPFPLAGRMLSIEPVYTQATGGNSFPILRHVIAIYGDGEPAFTTDLPEALHRAVASGDSP